MSQDAMNPQTARKLLEVGEAFRIPGPFFSYEEIKMGNVNHTYKVNYIRDDGTGMAKVKSYLVQRVNTYAFQRPVELMKNIDGVTGHIRQKHPGAQYLHFHHTQDGCNYLFDEDGFWRLSNYVPSVTYDSCDDLGVVRSAGEAFGSFQMMISTRAACIIPFRISTTPASAMPSCARIWRATRAAASGRSRRSWIGCSPWRSGPAR